MVHPIVPKYVSAAANTAVDLGSAPVDLRAGAVTIACAGKVRLELSGRERVVIEVDTDFDGYRLGDSPELQMKFGSSGQFVPVIVVRSQMGTSGTKLWLLVNGAAFRQVRDGRVRLSSAIVHVLNFPEFYCSGAAKSDFSLSNQRLGRVVLRNLDWEIELQALLSTNEIVKQLKAEGGNGITHVARIARVDCKSFTYRQLDAIVHDLQRFLSFARGAWTSLFGTVGFGRDGRELYSEWGERIATPWQRCQSWFDLHHGECLATAFPGFVTLLHDPALSQAGSAALHWYLRSNRAGEGAGVDGGLILSQAALERLSVSVLKNAGIILQNRPGATHIIRTAIQHLNIPTAIPQSSNSLHNLRSFSDGPEAVTKLRNELVHSEHRIKGKITSSVFFEAWQLAQWYTEAMLLKLCGYQGVYSYRLVAKWVGQVQPFP